MVDVQETCFDTHFDIGRGCVRMVDILEVHFDCCVRMVDVLYTHLYHWNVFLRMVHIWYTRFDMQRSCVRTVQASINTFSPLQWLCEDGKNAF